MITLQMQKDGNLISTDWALLAEALYALAVDDPSRVKSLGYENGIYRAVIPKEWKGQNVDTIIFTEAAKTNAGNILPY